MPTTLARSTVEVVCACHSILTSTREVRAIQSSAAMAGAAVAGLLASAFVRIAIGKLGSAITGQASLLWNFGKDLEEMKDHLETISAVLVDAERQSVKEELVRLWLKRLKNAAIDISDMLEEYQDSSDQASAKMPRVLSGLPMSYKKIAMANRMKSLREKLRKIAKEVAVFNFKKGSSTNNEQPYDERETMSYLPEEPVVGRDGEKKEIMNMLSAKTSNDDESVIVAIYGLGGMGKSTLAQLVYNDAQLKKYDYRIWVYVSQDFNLRKIGSSIISQLPTQEGQQNLGTHRRSTNFSECTGVLLPASIGEPKQLRCLIAPRMQNESLPECITELSKLQYLRLNGSTQISVLPESIGKLGCLRYLCLSGCSGISELPESFGGLKSMVHIDLSGCSGIRELPESFGDLKSTVRLDMSGCSGITKLPDSLGKLTNLQHLELSGCSSVKAIPEPLCGLRQLQYLNMSRCEQIRQLPETLMKLQNLLHLDLSDCSSMRHLGGVRGLTALQHLDMSGLRKTDLQYLSGGLANLTSLKYLGLSSVMGSASYVPDWIGGLTNLEHLDLSWNTGFACLPESIGNLKRLHTLNLSVCWGLKSLPESIRALGLKSLVLHGCSNGLVDQANSLVHFSQTLPYFRVRADDVNGCSNLHLLEGINVGELRIHSLENVRSLEEANKVKLLEKQNLSELRLTWTVGAVRLLEDKDLLGQLVPPRGLKHMCLEGYSSAGFPGWLMCIYRHLTNLVYIQLGEMPTCSNLPPLGQLPHLEKLFLYELPCIKRIDREFCGGKRAFRRLSSFQVSTMDGWEEWNTTYSIEDGVEEFMFPVLDRLEIRWCPRLRLKPCPPTFRECSIYRSDQVISCLEEVHKISHLCSSSSRAIKLDLRIEGDSCQSIRLFHHFPALRELRISGDHLMSVPESMRHLTSLECLTLQWCDRISALPEWLGNLSSLKSLVISACRSINLLPSCIQQLTKLQKLEIRYNPELKKWCESEENKTKLAHINIIQALED